MATDAQNADSRGYIVSVGDKAPEINFNLIDGSATSIDENKGKVIMLQFTGSWCKVCREEMPYIEKEIWQVYKDKELVLIGVDYDEPLETVKMFAEQTGITYPLALDPDAEIFQLFALKNAGVTRNIIINQEGDIVFLTRLFDRKEFDEMKEVIGELLE